MAADYQVLAVSGELLYTFDWTAQIPSTSPLTTISSVDYTLPSNVSPQELTELSTSENFTSYLSSIELGGAVHGKTYQVQAICTLSNGEKVVKGLTIKGWFGGF